ncbi:hypothetical protein EHZ19_14515 [Paraburkholderia bannensis]|nr:LysR substrate-binding domain-containing protein [Paraburkholderia bannensis]RQM47313.1 hypothetical protein EHZ19_14515 [Paraburkholderia bannensis]
MRHRQRRHRAKETVVPHGRTASHCSGNSRSAGEAALPSHLCEDDVARDTLIEVKTGGEAAAETGLFIVYPSRHDMSARVRAFAHHLAETLEAHAVV